ncbi:MAG: collagenase-like protease [Bacteroidia bacterium]|nr:MAG: collagenase-like protease [Bacteroidia bacterium]
MAPAGSFAALHAAAQGGANAVYFGIEQLNMRAKSANNFSIEDLPKITDICRQNNMRSYLTVNTILYDKDLPVMRKIMDAARDACVSAVIVSDQSAIQYASQIGLEIHISTQLNVSNLETIRFYSRFAEVIVPARELSLKQVKHITETIEKENITAPSGNPVQIEIFAHGALCMAVSGKCYLSLHERNASANRGSCQQTCRKGYVVTEKESGYQLEIDNEYIMSPKDLCTIGFVDKILDAGISVFKIEGRARPPEYVKTVTRCYREAVEAVFAGTYSKEKVKAWEKELSTVFNRGFWDGYYMGRKIGEWSKTYGSKATLRKSMLGKVSNYFSKIGVGEFKMLSGELHPGDRYLISGPTTGAVEGIVEELRLDESPVEQVVKGQIFSMPVKEKLRRSDTLYKMENVTDN